jgi:hypothetical protein
MPMSRTCSRKSSPKIVSRSRSKYRGSWSKGKASRSCCPVHPAVGWAVTTSHPVGGFRLFWTWKVRRGQRGRPVILREVRDLIREMCWENPGWGAPRLHGELLKLGIDIEESSVSKYMSRSRKPPSQTWRTFLENHAAVP